MKICVVGAGYVGLANAILLAQKYEVVSLDILPEKIEMLNNRCLPISDKLMEDFLKNKRLNFRATMNKKEAYYKSNYVVIAIPTKYDNKIGGFDVSNIEKIIIDIQKNDLNTCIIIKSTIPVGFTDYLNKKGYKNVIFVPEFLRENYAFYDVLYPSRIIIGSDSTFAIDFANLLLSVIFKKNVKVIFVSSLEAEIIKLFSNFYLALRIAYFNELDIYTNFYDLNVKNVIKGISLDPRIGDYYNNPSFGFGGSCLPKDIKQLLSNYNDIPGCLVFSVVKSNEIRKNFIIQEILKKKPKILGIYKLDLRSSLNDFKESIIYEIINKIKLSGIKIIIYEPILKKKLFFDIEIVENLYVFKKKSDVILVNRFSSCLNDVKNKVYTRDIFCNNF